MRMINGGRGVAADVCVALIGHSRDGHSQSKHNYKNDDMQLANSIGQRPLSGCVL
jgi:hypothetical protein